MFIKVEYKSLTFTVELGNRGVEKDLFSVFYLNVCESVNEHERHANVKKTKSKRYESFKARLHMRFTIAFSTIAMQLIHLPLVCWLIFQPA